MDAQDLLNKYRSQFSIPIKNEKEVIYFTGNSLGLQLYLEIQPLSVLHVLHVHPFLSIRSCVTPEVAPRLLKPTA